MSKILPESMYSLDHEMNHKKLSVFCENEVPITGKVIRLDLRKQFLKVDIGGGFIATMPFAESSIYPIFKVDGTISPDVFGLVGKYIQAKIVGFDGDYIVLSRKVNMLEALESLKEETIVKSALLTDFSKSTSFFDIGAGVIGRCCNEHFSTTCYEEDICVGSIISVRILDFIEDIKKFELASFHW